MKKIVLAKHKNQEIYPVTYSLAIIHKGELLYDFLENIPQPVASDFDIKDLSDVSGLRELWSDKQDTLIAGDGIEFSGLTIKVIGKQDTISDLSLIRSGASLGATSLQPNSLKTINGESLVGSGDIEIGDASDFDIKDLADSNGLRTTWSNKQNAISDLSLIRSGASLGTTSLQPNSLKTINGESLVGSGDIEIKGGLDEEAAIVIAAALNDLNDRLLAMKNTNE